MRPDGIIATTFTNAAANELKTRVQTALLKNKAIAEAAEVTQSLIGTVHSIGVSLMKRFAFEAGLSPFLDIIPAEEEKSIFSRSLANVINEEVLEKMENFRNAFGMDADEWKNNVRTIVDLARANNLDTNDLENSKNKSWKLIKELLPSINPQLELDFHIRFKETIEEAILSIDLEVDTTKKTSDTVDALKKIINQPDDYVPSWREYIQVSKLQVGAKSREALDELHEFVNQHLECQSFQEDLKNYIESVFDIAIQALEEYQRYKTQRALIDYTDMEVHLFRLLKKESVQSVLKEELDLLIVDEFQDTSPLQLAIFVLLSNIAKQAIWVGDTKQSIYSFRGADPKIMAQIIDWQGGVRPEDIQGNSFRSRPLLVKFVNGFFKKAFEGELPEEQICLNPVRIDNEAMSYPIEHWHFMSEQTKSGKINKNQLYNGLAHQLRQWVANSPNLQEGDWIRPIEYGDICILCRTNRDCLDVAQELNSIGIKAIVPRAGLMKTKEVQLLLACIRAVNDSNDTLAIAELLLLVDNLDLNEMVKQRLLFLREHENSTDRFDWQPDSIFITKLRELRPMTQDLSVSELCQLLFEQLNLKRIVAAWGNADQRWANLNKILDFANQYQTSTLKSYRAPTVNGFLTYFKKLNREGRDEQTTTDSRDAVRVMTYHKSKGLEWSAVICTALDNDVKASLFNPQLEDDNTSLDIQDILANRWVRFFPNPYSQQYQNTEFIGLLESTLQHQNKIRQAVREEARTLYVGLTRARDYQIFVSTTSGTAWLDRVYQGNVLDPHSDSSPFYDNQEMIIVKNTITNIDSIDNETTDNEEKATPTTYFQLPKGAVEFAKKLLHHSENNIISNIHLENPIHYNAALNELSESQVAQLKPYWKLYFSAHIYHNNKELKQHIIQHIASSIQDKAPDFSLDIVNAFYQFWSVKYPNARFVQHYPFSQKIDNRLFQTEIDVVIETEKEVVASIHCYETKSSELSKKIEFVVSHLKEYLPSHFPQKSVSIMVHYPLLGCFSFSD